MEKCVNMDETVIGMGKLNNDYITVDQYVEYFKKVFIKDIQLDKANAKFEKALNDDTYGRSVIKKDNIIYIKKYDLDDEVKLYKNSVDITFAAKAIIGYLGEEINSFRNISSLIIKRCNVYYIKLIHGKKRFISKDDLELISKKVNEVKEKKCIPKSQFLNMINNTFIGVEFSNLPHRIVVEFIRENNLEFIHRNFIGNFYSNGEFLYPQKTVNKVMEYLLNEYVKKKVKLFNITFEEYLELNKTDFENEYRALEKEDILDFEEP
ncbi:hypothetical protein LF65_01958 [Clostridium beijerinckii]|uniref:Uncharacterized protein n=1 Tax=Clostridium beijerinckii TaxID=1520 RepID=A0A0B5QJX8_CLOBE|nr:hypothetical protein [Clostridium beijerinckii]AJG98556.1 hypothetical protein LF65_01958 [Clostridium beijerinckii]